MADYTAFESPDARARRVDALKAQVEAGAYHLPGDAVADKVILVALQGALREQLAHNERLRRWNALGWFLALLFGLFAYGFMPR